MGWLRTNWLDALIFLLVAAIMAGVVLFLTGVNPFGGSRGGQTPPSVVAPAAPQQAPAPPSQPQPQTAPAAPQPRPQTPHAAKPEPETVVTVLPIPQAPATPSPATKPVPAPPKVEDRPSSPAQPEVARPAPPRPERPNLTADAGGGWRVVVGSFGNRTNAERLAATLRQQGYPVRLEVSGELTRVWVGPYSSQARARAIASTLSAYQPRVAQIAASSPATPPSQPQTEATPSTGRFLQVGAFRNAQSAQSVVETVRQAGYPVILVEEGGLVKVRVGPLDDTSAAASALRARGLEVLEVR